MADEKVVPEEAPEAKPKAEAKPAPKKGPCKNCSGAGFVGEDTQCPECLGRG